MSTLQIRNMPEELYQALLLRAEREHRSLNQQVIVELREISALQSRHRRLQTLQRIAADLNPDRPAPTVAPEMLIREDRER